MAKLHTTTPIIADTVPPKDVGSGARMPTRPPCELVEVKGDQPVYALAGSSAEAARVPRWLGAWIYTHTHSIVRSAPRAARFAAARRGYTLRAGR